MDGGRRVDGSPAVAAGPGRGPRSGDGRGRPAPQASRDRPRVRVAVGSRAGSHNTGQVIAYCFVMQDTRLLISYLPILVGIGAVVGYLTGIITERVLKVLKYPGVSEHKEKDS